MKVLHLSESDTLPGAPRAAYRLHRSQIDIGLDSRLLVRLKLSDDPTVHRLNSALERPLRRAQRWLDALPLKQYPRRSGLAWTVGWAANGIERAVARLRPDVIHLHWMGFGFLPVSALPKFGAPLVWTLRDMHSFTGGCHYDQGCGRYQVACGACPQLGSAADNDLSRRTLERKRALWRGLDLTLVGLSRWIAARARSSALFRDARTEVIPNGIDVRRFKPVDRAEARRALGLPEDRQVILFGATNSTRDRRKGFHLLAAALETLARSGLGERACAAVFGADGPLTGMGPSSGGEGSQLDTRYLGTIHDEARLVQAYSAADVFVAPSIEEVFGNTVLESLACGTPCVAFDTGGIPDLIEHRFNGYLARAFEPDDLAAGIAWVLEDGARRESLSRAARLRCESEFDARVVAGRYGALYVELAERRAAGRGTSP